MPILALIGLGIEDDTRDIVRLPRLSLPRTPLSSSLSLPLSRCCAQAVLVIQLLCVSIVNDRVKSIAEKVREGSRSFSPARA